MGKRLALALGIWFLLMIVYTNFFMPKPEALPPAAGATNAQAPAGSQAAAPAVAPSAVPAVPVAQQAVAAAEVSSNEAAEVRTAHFSIGLNRVEGALSRLEMVEYTEGGAPIRYVDRNIKGFGNFRVGFRPMAAMAAEPELVYNHEALGPLSHRFSTELTTGEEKGLAIVKTYTFYSNERFFDLAVAIENRSGKAFAGRSDMVYSILWGSPVEWWKAGGGDSYYDSIKTVYLDVKDELDRTSESKVLHSLRWLGFEDRYFLFTVIPVNEQGAFALPGDFMAAIDINQEAAINRFALARRQLVIQDKTQNVDRFRIYLGPKRHSLLTEANVAVYRLDRIFDDFVLIKWLSIGFEKLIYLVHAVFSNFGIVIIIVTMLVKLLLHPLTHKSFVSMRKMQLIQPKMAALKEQFKNDPQNLNRRMMELYKKEGVNPMGGCLPILLQLPIFIALYQVLPRLVDLKNVSFLWISDLSSPDTVARIEDFRNVPLLPVNINILPLVMTAVSVIQSKLQAGRNSAAGQTDQQRQQAKLMMIMPIMFLFLFWNMPSGLVLYWTVQNVLSIFEQMMINKRYAAPAAAGA